MTQCEPCTYSPVPAAAYLPTLSSGTDLSALSRSILTAALSCESAPLTDVGRVATGVPDRVKQLKVLGNGQVPMQAALAWKILMGDR